MAEPAAGLAHAPESVTCTVPSYRRTAPLGSAPCPRPSSAVLQRSTPARQTRTARCVLEEVPGHVRKVPVAGLGYRSSVLDRLVRDSRQIADVMIRAIMADLGADFRWRLLI